jgi:hypothetical protein
MAPGRRYPVDAMTSRFRIAHRAQLLRDDASLTGLIAQRPKVWLPGGIARSQWRDRAGFSPASSHRRPSQISRSRLEAVAHAGFGD